MVVRKVAHLIAARREAATVRMLLEELEQLTGEAAEQVSEQLAEELAVLGRRLLDASAAIAAVQALTNDPCEGDVRSP